MADLAARLDARRNLDLVGVAIGIGNLDHPAERGGREADRRARVERGALAIEQRMPRDMDEDVEIARRRAARARLAFARQAAARSLVHPGGDIDRPRPGSVAAALAAAVPARLGEPLARPAA